jgi:hypothetical protein
MLPAQDIFLAEFFILCGAAPVAPSMTVWALFRSRYRRMAAVTALCLWCVLAGAALMGSMWGWMAETDRQVQLRKIASLPRGARSADVRLDPMGSVLFLVALDRLGRRLWYLPVLLPLWASARIARKALGEHPAEKQKPFDPEGEIFSPYGS